MRKRAYKFSRDMVWNTVARSYLILFAELKQERAIRARAPMQAPGLRPQTLDLPEIKLNHLQLLSDDTGILQHARFMIPSREHGYTADDNARALIVTMLAQDYMTDSNLLEQMSCRYLSFQDHAHDAKTGRFRNYMSYNRRWSQRSDYEDCQARVLWSLGVSVVHSRKDSQIGMAMDLFERALPAFDEFRSPRALAMLDTLVHNETAYLAGVAQEIILKEVTTGEEEEGQTAQRLVFQTPRTVDYRPSVQDIASYLLELMEDEALRKKMDRAGRKRVVERFDYRVVTRRFIDLICRRLGFS